MPFVHLDETTSTSPPRHPARRPLPHGGEAFFRRTPRRERLNHVTALASTGGAPASRSAMRARPAPLDPPCVGSAAAGGGARKLHRRPSYVAPGHGLAPPRPHRSL